MCLRAKRSLSRGAAGEARRPRPHVGGRRVLLGLPRVLLPRARPHARAQRRQPHLAVSDSRRRHADHPRAARRPHRVGSSRRPRQRPQALVSPVRHAVTAQTLGGSPRAAPGRGARRHQPALDPRALQLGGRAMGGPLAQRVAAQLVRAAARRALPHRAALAADGAAARAAAPRWRRPRGVRRLRRRGRRVRLPLRHLQEPRVAVELPARHRRGGARAADAQHVPARRVQRVPDARQGQPLRRAGADAGRLQARRRRRVQLLRPGEAPLPRRRRHRRRLGDGAQERLGRHDRRRGARARPSRTPSTSPSPPLAAAPSSRR